MAEKLKRDAFIYLDPRPPEDRFAQCSTCRDWFVGDDRCKIHGPDIEVKGTATCAAYVWGFNEGGEPEELITPEESGLEDRPVRCENCKWFTDICTFFDMLNKQLPEVFDLDVAVDAKGCCNANQARS